MVAKLEPAVPMPAQECVRMLPSQMLAALVDTFARESPFYLLEDSIGADTSL